jgi:hypothetical protein
MVMNVTTKGIGITKDSANALGEPYPLNNGWFNRLIGKEVTQEAYQKALESHLKKKASKDTNSRQKPILTQIKPTINDLFNMLLKIEYRLSIIENVLSKKH